MGFFSRFEHHVEDGFEGINEKLFDAPISPVQIEKKAEKQMRREKMVGAGKEFAPTLYTVLVNPDDDERLFGYYPTLAGETETYLRAKAMEQGLAMDGSPLVRFIVDEDLKPGKFDVIAELVSAPIVKQLREEEMARYGLGGAFPNQHANNQVATYNRSAQSNPQPQQGSYNQSAQGALAGDGAYNPSAPDNFGNPNLQEDLYAHPHHSDYLDSGLDIMAESPAQYDQNQAVIAEPIMVGQTMHLNNAMPSSNGTMRVEPHLVNLTTGRTFSLTQTNILIGRAANCDIVLNDLNVSRTHAEIRRESTTAWSVADLGSTNGTLVNGRHIAQTMLSEGDRITTGTTTFLFTYH